MVKAGNDPSDLRLRQLLQNKIVDADDLAEALRLMRAHPALAAARAEVERRAELAKGHLAVLPQSDAREALFELCDQIVSRNT